LTAHAEVATTPRVPRLLAVYAVLLTAIVTACKPLSAPERDDVASSAASAGVDAAPGYSAARGYDPNWTRRDAAAKQSESRSDPHGGQFSLAQATADLRGDGPLQADITTNRGTLRCRLMADKAPLAVANFVGLANGTRAWKTRSGWRRAPAYDGSSFELVTPSLAIIGGTPASGGKDAPGYFITDERWSGMRHDRAGLLCTRGVHAGRAGAAFLITDGPTPSLDTRPEEARKPAFTVFGSCEPVALIHQIAASPATHGRPEQRIVIERVRVTRLQQ
jgi:peptidyl-prolyl cis-trans isomerase A (cyclophilin A)